MFGRRNKCQLNAKLSELYTIEIVNSLIHMCERDNHHDPVDVGALDAGVLALTRTRGFVFGIL
jgi:hypothetical protein